MKKYISRSAGGAKGDEHIGFSYRKGHISTNAGGARGNQHIDFSYIEKVIFLRVPEVPKEVHYLYA